jgi:GntR family transcriptional regulator of arabinose operon
MAKFKQIADSLTKRIILGGLGPGSRMPSEKELAREFEVSVQTANKALAVLESSGVVDRREGLGAFVSDRLNPRDLLSSSRFTVSLVLDANVQGLPAADGILGRLAFNLQHVLSKSGFAWDQVSRLDAPEVLERTAESDAFVTLGDVDEGLLERIRRGTRPCITFNRSVRKEGFYSVLVNPDVMGELAGRMAEVGRRRFLYVTDDQKKQVYDLRWKAYEEAARSRGLSCERLVLPASSLAAGTATPEDAAALRRSDFAFLPNDSLALAYMRLLERQGIRVPEDHAVCGFDNSAAGRHAAVPLTTIAYDILEASNVVADTVRAALHHGSPPPLTAVDAWIIWRASTETRSGGGGLG